MSYKNKGLLNTISQRIGKELISKPLPEVLDAVTELQKLKIYLDEHVLSIIVRQLKQNRDRLIKQDIIPVLKVLRSHKYRDEFLMEMIADSARQQLHKVPDLITLLEHFVAFQTYDGVLYFLCALHFRNSLDRYSLQELINIVQVFSRALHFDRELFEAVLLRLYDYLDDMSSYEYAAVIKGIAKFDEEVCRESARMFAEYLFDSGICREEDLNVISVARSLAFLRLWERGLWDKVSWRIQKILNKFAGRQLPLRKLYDLFHAQSMAEACGASHVKLIDIKDRQSTLRTLQEKLQRRPITTSKLQDDIFHSLKRLGYRSIEAEKRIDLPMRFVDIALSVEGVPVAFEVDGPMHFTRNPPYRPLSKTVCRDLLAASRGWRVVSLPFLHWQSLSSRERKDEMLRTMVQEALEGNYYSKLLQKSCYE